VRCRPDVGRRSSRSGLGTVGSGSARGGGLEAMTSSSVWMLSRFWRVCMTANSIEERVQDLRSSSSSLSSRSEILVVRVFWSLYSAILAARMSAADTAFLGSAGRME
jgi:hypothetical protein